MSIERALVVSSWPDCSGFPASGPYAKKKALPTDDDALVRAAILYDYVKFVTSKTIFFPLSFFFSFFFLFQGGFLDRDRVEPVGVMVYTYIHIAAR